MSSDKPHGRRGSSVQSVHGIPIPRAPPLPISAPRPLQRARDVASRFLGYTPSRPPSPPDVRDEERFTRGSALFRRRPSLGIAQDASASHKTGLKLNTIAINESGSHALIGGEGIFKTVKIEDGRCVEDMNLRTRILSTPRNASGAPRDIFQIDIADVAWAKGQHSNYVVAATSSGKIILYNIAIAGLQAVLLHEHSRQVHKVTFNPHHGNLLLSGSQDGTVRLWDIRKAKCLQKYSGQADGVRDVKWSPTDGFDFAFCTDSGDVQRWDLRADKAAKGRVSAHTLACNAIDWHPDGKHVISAGSDKVVRVYDLSVSRPKKAAWEIRTPFPVMNARWRPSCESPIRTDDGARLCSQVVTSYDAQHPIVHLWDLRRPHLPFREMTPYESAPTDLLWHSQDLLWTVGSDAGIFRQTDMHFVPKVIEKRNLQTLAVSPRSELVFVSQARARKRGPNLAKSTLKTKTSSNLSVSPDGGFLSRSFADDSIDHQFLELDPPLRAHGLFDGSARVQIMPTSSQSQAHSHVEAPTIRLDDLLINRKSFRPQQVSCRGSVPGADVRSSQPSTALQEMSAMQRDMTIEELIEKTPKLIDKVGQAALDTDAPRLHQTWSIVRFCLMEHLRGRATLQSDIAKGSEVAAKSCRSQRLSIAKLASNTVMHYLKSPTHSPMSMHPISSLGHHLGIPESTSNVPTPVARPTTRSKLAHLPSLPDPDDESIVLPPSLTHDSSAFETAADPVKKDDFMDERRLTADNLIDHERQQQEREHTADRNDMVRRWSVHPRVPLNFDNIERRAVRSPLEKHDSEESFKFLENSLDSRSAAFPESFNSVESHGEMVADGISGRANLDFGRHLSEDYNAAFEPLPFDGSGTLADSRNNVREEAGGSFESKPEVSGHWSPDRTDTHLRQDSVDMTPASASQLVPASMANSPRESSAPAQMEDNMPDHAFESTVRDNNRTVVSRDSRPFGPARASKVHHVDLGQTREVDYYDLEDEKPWTLVEMLQQLLHFYTSEQPHPQAVSLLILLVTPLLPLTHPLADIDVTRCVRNYIEYALDHLNVEVEDLQHWLQACHLEQTLQAGLQPLQLENALSTYHEQMLAQRSFTAAAELRKCAYPAFPAVYEDFIKNNVVHFKCGHCGKPMPSGMQKPQCEHCSSKRERCAICRMPRSPWSIVASEEGQDRATDTRHVTVMTSCLTCGHSGHTECYHRWYVEAEGVGCPTEGCLCVCVDARRTS